MKLIIKYLKRHKFLFVLNLVAILAYTATELGIPTIMAAMINHGVSTQDMDFIQSRGMILILISLIGGV
ncbi:MAG TPA: ABC transporter ATP-binding protein, partial [Erysipelothrix sp.]|nr:ABC transporter ATP-binding protein [Erysipelothrix sp.]